MDNKINIDLETHEQFYLGFLGLSGKYKPESVTQINLYWIKKSSSVKKSLEDYINASINDTRYLF